MGAIDGLRAECVIECVVDHFSRANRHVTRAVVTDSHGVQRVEGSGGNGLFASDRAENPDGCVGHPVHEVLTARGPSTSRPGRARGRGGSL